MKLPSWVQFTLSTYGEHPRIALAMVLAIVVVGGAVLLHLLTISALVPESRPSAPHTIPPKLPASAPAAPASRTAAPSYLPSAPSSPSPLLATGFAASSPFKPDRVAQPERVTKPESVAEPERVLAVTGLEFAGSVHPRRFADVGPDARACPERVLRLARWVIRGNYLSMELVKNPS